MAPLSTDPRQLLVTLNVARRKALYSLATEITAYMRSQIELPETSPESSPPPTPSRRPSDQRSPPAARGDAPLFVPHPEHPDDSPQSPQQQRHLPRHAPTSPALVRLRRAALLHFDSWRAEVLGKLKEILAAPDDQKIIDARRKRNEMLAKRRTEVPDEGEDLLSFGDASGSVSGSRVPGRNLGSMQSLYHAIPTRLDTISMDDRKEALSSVLLLLLSIGKYSSYSRAMVCYLASALQVSPKFLDDEETQIATTMVESAQKADEQEKSGMSAEAEAQKRKEQNQASRYWKVGLASVAGAAIIGVTGGLAAPVVAGAIGGLMGSVGLGGLASFLGIFWMNGALVGTIFGAMGAKMTGEMTDQYAKEVEDFRFLPLKDEWGENWKKDGPEVRRLRVTIGINGWLKDEGDVTKHWRALGEESEVFALRYEMKSLMALGASLEELVSSYAWATLWSALWPAHLMYVASNIDNPFSLARNRSEKAGKILADALINKVQGERPVTLVGYSLGARVIYSCLRQLAERRAFGLVDSVVLIGAPVPSNPVHWQMMKTVVSGKLFNVYSENDYILAFLYRTTSAQLGIAGLQGIDDEVKGVENLDLSAEVNGHLRYPELIAKILARCGFPNVKGGEGEIEKEDEHIQLRDKDYAETGNLIDIDEPRTKKLEPSKHSLEEMANEKFDPRVPEEHRWKTAEAPVMKTPSPLPEANDPLTAGFGVGAGPSNATLAGTRHKPLNEPPPRYSKFVRGTSSREQPGSDEEDEEGWGGIQMHAYDDDADMVTVEPLSIEDRD
ncbi:hypothetical protein BJ170DRAFT_702294 [Xylariales sp. AK1849]|nr:hypothetical protein BJ170DRAFT_702294 [Xylariales sp. AK1849]